jgi:MFS family permease
LLSGIFANGVTSMLLTIFMAYVGLQLVNLNATEIIIGIVFFSRNFFQIFLRVPFGHLAQIVGRRPMITLGSLFHTVAFGLMFLATSPGIVLAAMVMMALGMALYYPAIFSYIGDISNGDYGRVNGYIFQGGDIGVILGTYATSYLLRNGYSISEMFGLGGVVGTVGTILIYLTLSETLAEEDRQQVDSVFKALFKTFRDSISSVKSMTRTHPLGKVYSFQFVLAFTEFFFGSFFPLLLVLFLGLTNPQVADVLFIATIVNFIVKPYLGSLSDRFGFRTPAVGSLLVTSVSLFLLTLSSNYVFIVVIITVITASSLTGYLAVNGGTGNFAPVRQRGVAMGVLGFYVSFGRSSSSAIVTPLWSYFEQVTGDQGLALRNIFWITAIMIFAAALLLALFSRNMVSKREFDNQENRITNQSE